MAHKGHPVTDGSDQIRGGCGSTHLVSFEVSRKVVRNDEIVGSVEGEEVK